MKQDIINNSTNPQVLEELYRNDPKQFELSFNEAYTEIKDKPIAQFWNARLNFEKDVSGDSHQDNLQGESQNINHRLLFTVIAAIISGSIIRIPGLIFGESENYILNNLAFFVIPFLAVYYLVINKAELKNIIIVSAVTAAGVLFMNIVPWNQSSDTQRLSSLHMIFIMWAVLGAAFTGFSLNAREKQMEFIKRNGDVLVLSGIVMVCGMFLTALSTGLFKTIGIKLPEMVFKTIASYGIPAAFIAANYMVESSPKIINKVTPVISKIFTPLILLLMTVFLVVLAFFGKSPFDNRDELIVFNVLLAVNMGVIVFSFSGDTEKPNSFRNKVLLFLSAEALIINLVALSSIIYRLYMFGLSPNRLAIIGVNVLMFVNLIIISVKLLSYVRSKTTGEDVRKSMTSMLLYYTVWAAIAAYIFPFIFGYK